MRLFVLLLACLVLVGCTPREPSVPTAATAVPTAATTPLARLGYQWPVSDSMKRRGQRVADLSAHANEDDADPLIDPRLRQRQALLDERARLSNRGDSAEVAGLNSVLASEAFGRAASVTRRWLDRRDAPTGLFPHTLRRDGRIWTYGDAGSDLFPFLALATRYLVADRYPEILATLAAERALSSGLPQDISLDTRRPVRPEPEKRMLEAVEYAKDGLLPMVEALGPEPWLPRLREVIDQVIAASAAPTPYGPIPADSTEVNGSALQALARLYWATRDPKYLQMGDRIAAAYLDRALPRAAYLPPQRWDFMENEPVGPRELQLGDHGNEIVSGLVEWHRVELLTGSPVGRQHRQAIREMLERLLSKGRTPDGLWYELIDVPSGKVRDKELTDNWGYLGQAYLNQADIERTLPGGGDRASGDRFAEGATTALRAASAVNFYAWERGEMDGYADTLEGALYLLRYLDVPEASAWVDRQMPVLYGFQRGDGSVTDENIDGNFVRTALLYGLRMTRGVRVEPWNDGVSVGAAMDGPCLQVHLHTEAPWSGRLLFDSSRHHAHFGLPSDYPRLNQWPEWFSVLPDGRYTLQGDGVGSNDHRGEELAMGILMTLAPDREYRVRACPG